MSNSLQPHGLQHARLPCPSPTPRACSNSCPSNRWCHPTVSSYGKFLKRWKYQTILPASWEICMQVKKQQLELDMEQWTGSKLGKEYTKAVDCHPAYLTYMQSTSGFPGGSDGKASACNVGDPVSIPRLGRSPRKGNGNPLRYSCLENSMGRGAW